MANNIIIALFAIILTCGLPGCQAGELKQATDSVAQLRVPRQAKSGQNKNVTGEKETAPLGHYISRKGLPQISIHVEDHYLSNRQVFPNGSKLNGTSHWKTLFWNGEQRVFFLTPDVSNIGTPLPALLGNKTFDVIDSIMVLDGKSIRPIDNKTIDFGEEYNMLRDGSILQRVANGSFVPVSDVDVPKGRSAATGPLIAELFGRFAEPLIQCILWSFNCGSDSDCCALMICENICKWCNRKGERCSVDLQCCGSLFCEAGFCADCHELGRDCKSSSECCGSGNICLSRKCTPCRKPTEACRVASDCCKMRNCIGGKCQKCQIEGTYCATNSDCCFGNRFCADRQCWSKPCGGGGVTCDFDSDCCKSNPLCKIHGGADTTCGPKK